MPNEDLRRMKQELMAKGMTKESLGLMVGGGQMMPQLQQPQSAGKLLGDFISRMGGGKPEDSTSDLAKLYQQEAIKKQFDKPDYVVSYDQEGKPVFTQAPGAIKNAPFYSTPQGGNYYQEKTRQAGSQATQAETETGLMQTFQEDIAKGKPMPVGTTQQAGPYNIPLNPKLDEAQTNVVSGVNKYEPMVDRLEQLVNEGALQGTGHKLMAEYGNKNIVGRYLTPDNSPIEELASIASELQKYMFSEGGKTLSPTEKGIVNSGLTFAGKSDEQIKHDFSEAIKILRLKKDIIFGGMNAAIQQQPVHNPVEQPGFDPSKLSEEELKALANG